MLGRNEVAPLDKLTNHEIRTAVWNNRVSFPSQIPVFEKQSRMDIQWRLVQLYFVRRWSFRHLAKRYGVSPQRIMQIIGNWRVRAVALGYIQEIPAPDAALTQGD
jgi:DNA-binding Xre family transcriptional regulator